MARIFGACGLGAAWVGLIALILAGAWPVSAGDSDALAGAARRMDFGSDEDVNVEDLVWKMAGNWLIKPSQVQAAVRDDGKAKRLVGQLSLQGIVQMGGERVAYIAVKGQSARGVRQGQTVQEFVVTKIEPGRVTLSLDGVEVTLRS